MSVQTGEQIKVNIDYLNQGQRCTCGIGYTSLVTDANRTAFNFAQDFWVHIRTQWRALMLSNASIKTTHIRIASITNVAEGMYGTFPIPPAEELGTRVEAMDLLPSYMALAIRFNVDGRLVRPGQMRVSVFGEFDHIGQSWTQPIQDWAQQLANRFVVPLNNQDAIPMAIARGTVFGGPVLVDQPNLKASAIVSADINPYSTTQVSRKQGRGI